MDFQEGGRERSKESGMEFKNQEAAPWFGPCSKAALTLQAGISAPKTPKSHLSPRNRLRKHRGTHLNQQESLAHPAQDCSVPEPRAGAGSPGKLQGRDDAIPRHARAGSPRFAVY